MDKITEAAKLLAAGAAPEEREQPSARGRPSRVFKVGGIEMSRKELAKARDAAAAMAIDSLPKVMTPEDFVTFSRSATPMLVHRAVCLAMQSEDARVVLAVAKEISARGYGAIVQSTEITLGPDVRGAWKQLAEYAPPVVDGEFIEEEDLDFNGESIE